MYVLLDIEWVTDENNQDTPTQLAALRVTNDWSPEEEYFSRICTLPPANSDWGHIAFRGGSSEDFLTAKPLSAVAKELQQWLRPDDVLCFWHGIPANTFTGMMHAQGAPLQKRILVLSRYIEPHLLRLPVAKNTPKRIVHACGGTAEKPSHNSLCDVKNMRLALSLLGFREEELHAPAPQTENELYLDETGGILHKSGCGKLPPKAVPIRNPGRKFLFHEAWRICDCAKQDVGALRRKQNRITVFNTEYNYVYAKKSPVFHRRNCGVILNTTDTILGSVHYKTCAATGRRPCKLCKPEPEPLPPAAAPKKTPPPPRANKPKKQRRPSVPEQTWMLGGDWIWIHPEKIVGCCHNAIHPGKMTEKMMKQHDCIGKQCRFFEKYEKSTYWLQQKQKQAEKANRKKLKQQEQLRQQAHAEKLLAFHKDLQCFAEQCGYDMKIVSVKQESTYVYKVLYVSGNNFRDAHLFPDLQPLVYRSYPMHHLALRHVRDEDGKFVTTEEFYARRRA